MVPQAQANQTYQIAATSDAVGQWSSDPGADAVVRQAEAQALADWVSTMSTPVNSGDSPYVAYERAMAQASATQAASEIEASTALANQDAQADVTYTFLTRWPRPSRPARTTSQTSDQQEYNVADAGHQNSRRDTEAQADKAREVAFANADEQQAVDLAQAQKTYEVAIINSPSDATEALATLTAAQAAANAHLVTGWDYVTGIGPVTGEADADMAWQKAYAGADKQ